MQTPELIIVGSMALDSVETPFGKVTDVLGGSATYASLAASYFAKPGVVSIVGQDFPAEHEQTLAKFGVDLAGLKHKGKTFRWSGSYEFAMNEAITHKTELNVLLEFKPKLPEQYLEAKFLMLGNLDPSIQLNVIGQVKHGTFIMMDTMNFWITSAREKLLEVINKVHVVVINEGEARQLIDTPNLIKAGRKILEMGPQYVIIKKGEHGAMLFGQDLFFAIPGYPLDEVRDPTGAGDSFAGALIGYLARAKATDHAALRRAIIYGSAVASACAEQFSTRYRDTMSLKDIEERVETFKKMREF